MAEGVLKRFLEEVRLIGTVGVAETSYYPALKELFQTVGDNLKPKVVFISHPKGKERTGIPDGGLFIVTKALKSGEVSLESGTLPERGAVEVKPPTEDVRSVATSEQGRKYLAHYGHLLVTNLRHFALYRLEKGEPTLVDEVILADSNDKFKAMLARPDLAEAEHGTFFVEFLTRALLTGAPLTTPQAVAGFLASYAREALRRAENAPDSTPLEGVRKALEDALGITFEAEKGRHFFLSTMVQTLFYGLFSGWVLWHEANPSPTEKFRRVDTTEYLRVPMVDALFQNLAGPKTLEPLGLKELLDRAVDVLNRVDTVAFFAAFEERNAVQYFYEPFLASFDQELREQLGVWYTPKEIVRYQVQRVDQLLRHELGLPDGLADESVVVLDPCCGTGTYLVEVLALIEERLTARYGPTLAPDKVKQAVLNRIFGFELIPAPYVVAHLQLGLMLNRKHAGLTGNERVRIYLTNALTGWDPAEDVKKNLGLFQLEEEREAAREVKRAQPILVILGNPPYYGYAGIAGSSEERKLSDAYRSHGSQGQGLNDLYVRFFRMAERRITEAEPGQGIVCYISNYSWLDGLSHPGMRNRFAAAFDKIWIDNLHGDRKIGEYAPDGSTSQTVFAVAGQSSGIQIGTAITTLLRTKREGSETKPVHVRYRDHQAGDAAQRRMELLASAKDESMTEGYQVLTPNVRLGLPFKPRTVSEDYLDWPTLPELIPTSYPGVQTSRDEFLVDIDKDLLVGRIADYFDTKKPHEQLSFLYPSIMEESRRYPARLIRDKLLKRGIYYEGIRKYYYRPFDTRWIYWEPNEKLLDEKRSEYVAALSPTNVSIVLAQDNRRGFDPPISCNLCGSRHLIERGANHFLLKVRHPSAVSLFECLEERTGYEDVNLAETAAILHSELGLKDVDCVFFHALATMHSPAYREANAGALRQDWPRIPWPAGPDMLPSDRDALRQALERSAELGRRVAALLDSETPVPGVTTGTIDPDLKEIAVFNRLDGTSGGKPNYRLQARWGYRGQGGVVMPATGRITDQGTHLLIHANEDMGWHNVPREVWEYKLGGYTVLKKWLSYREYEVLGRDLKVDEVIHVTDTARRIAALIRLGPELDAAHAAVCAALK